jgi:hypothetical protein
MAEPRPAPFVVGVARSGTTLLRFMLDAHSQLAIPPETGFIPTVGHLAPLDREGFLETVIGFESWPDFHLDAALLRERVRGLVHFSVGEGLRAFYRLYAERLGKPGWGDKTPSYGLLATAIEALLPEARFIHIIRDGRDVALSVRPLWFAPGPTVEDEARHWAEHVGQTRLECGRCRHAIEVRYEDLVTAPEPALRRLCAFLDLPFEPGMLSWHEKARERLEEHEGRVGADGRVRLTRDERIAQQRRVATPPDRSRVLRWKREMSGEDQRRFQRVAGGMLEALGYEVA